MDNQELIERAKSVVHRTKIGDRWAGDVGCALLTEKGNIYLGVCIDTGSGTGFCAEHSAIAAMVTAGEFRIRKIIAVWMQDGETFILSPCGRCREFIHQMDEGNLETEVILDIDKTVKLIELLPHPDWFHKIP